MDTKNLNRKPVLQLQYYLAIVIPHYISTINYLSGLWINVEALLTPQRSDELVGKDFKNNESWNIFAVASVVFVQPFPMQLKLRTHSHLYGTVLLHSTHRAVITMSNVCLGHMHKQTHCKSITKLFGTHTKGTQTHSRFSYCSPLLFPSLRASLGEYVCPSHSTATICACFFVTSWTERWELVS